MLVGTIFNAKSGFVNLISRRETPILLDYF